MRKVTELKINYLGTAAAERVPAIFCNCEVCQNARRLGGREIRTQTQTLLDDGNLLIDFPGDSYLHMVRDGLNFNEIEHLLITHWHSDHLYAEDLALRMSGYGQKLDKVLHVYGSAYVKKFFDRAFELEGRTDETRIDFHVLQPYEEYTISHYLIYPLPAQHGHFQEDCLIYVIQDRTSGKTFFYTHDTGMLPDSELNILAQKAFSFDCVSLDCTGQIAAADYGPSHLSFLGDLDLLEKLRVRGLVRDDTVLVTNHFSHNGGLNHEAMVELAAGENMLTAYDGMTLEI